MPLALLAAFSACAAANANVTARAQGQDPVSASGITDIERGSTPALSRIRADYAHLRGITGRGVTIAVLDSGIASGHPEFLATGRLLPGFNAVDGGTDIIDRAGHGTHVAGIIGAGRDGHGMMGVAYEATLLPVKVFPDCGTGSTAALDRGLHYAIGKASIVNMSVGAANAYDGRAMQEAVQSGLLLVASAGNDGAASPGWPARFAKETWAAGRIIAVGAVDADNRIASFSDRAGDTAAWFMVAPGTGILSTWKDNQYARMSGTSMAAPLVSGAAALVLQLWPSLRAEQVATILFVTATDLGAPGIDPVYGRGLLNVERALQPIGALTTTTYNGKTIRVLEGSLQPSAATSRLWSLAASGQLRVVGFDDFERDFGVDLGAAVARPPAMPIDQVLDNMARRIDTAEQVLDNGARLALAFDGGAQPQLAALSLRMQAGGTETAFGIGATAQAYFGAAGLHLAQGVSLAQVAALAPAYFSLVPHASHVAVAHEVLGFKLKFGALTSGFAPLLASQQGYPSSSAAMSHATAGVVEIAREFDSAVLSLSVSQTHESNAWLGAWSTGSLALGDEAATSSVQLSGALLLAPQLALAGQAAYGVTPGSGPRDSLIAEVTQMRTNAFSLALVASDRLRQGDRLSLSLSQPLRAYAGHIAVDLLSAGGDGVQTRERLVFSMAPLGRELRVELNYQAPLDALSSFGVSWMLRRDPNNIADAAMEHLLALRYAQQF